MGSKPPPEPEAECGEAEALEPSSLTAEEESQGEEKLKDPWILQRSSAEFKVASGSDRSIQESLASPPYAPRLVALCTNCGNRRNPCGTYKCSSEGLESSNRDIRLNGGTALIEREEVKSLSSENTDEGQHMSFFKKAKQLYSNLVSAIIRPTRLLYDPKAELGPSKFIFRNRLFKRTDFEVVNAKMQSLKCSHWEPGCCELQEPLPCVVYLHGNSSARIEAISQLATCLRLGCTVCSFDFAGSGLSDGEYVSLGYWEREDLAVVIEYLQKVRNVGSIAIWGRSMGAATALMYIDRNPSIAALVLDSAFTDLTTVVHHFIDGLRETGIRTPNLLVKLVFRMIRSSVQRMAGFDIKDIEPIVHARSAFSPALFIAGEDDNFILPNHSRQIHDVYAGEKNFVLVGGDHNANRPSFLFHSVFIFLQNALHLPDSMILDMDEPIDYGVRVPWISTHSEQCLSSRM